jgi:hypothetical protein
MPSCAVLMNLLQLPPLLLLLLLLLAAHLAAC